MTLSCARQPYRVWPVVALAMVLGAAACGKKGPPLPPLANVPTAPLAVTTRRAGDTVTIRFTVPTANVTNIQPANIERVDVYAWTGQQLPPDQIYKLAPVVASVQVRRPPPPPPEQKEGEPPPPPPPPPTGPGVDQGTVVELTEQLTPETLVPIVVPEKKKKKDEEPVVPLLTPPDVALLPAADTLTRYYIVVGVNRSGRRGPAAARQAVPLWNAPEPPSGLKAEVKESGITLEWTPPAFRRRPILLAPAPAPTAPAAVAGSPGSGAAGTAPAVPAAVPGQPAREPDDEDEDAVAPEQDDAATAQQATAPPATGTAVAPAAPAAPGAAAQSPSSGTGPGTPAAPQGTPGAAAGTPATPGAAAPAPAPTPGLTAAGLIASRVLTPWPVLGTAYYVYEVAPPNAASPSNVAPPPAAQPFPRLLTASAVGAVPFQDQRVVYGTERCYVVRTVELVGTMVQESEPSNMACVKPVDVFPPAAPKSLGAVASEGAISLIWDANTESDLAGYIVLRSVAPGDRLEPLTRAPIHETTYRDDTVKTGTRYVYVVIAVDTAKPPNRSGPSNRVEEIAR